MIIKYKYIIYKCFYIRHVTINYSLADNDVLTIKRTNKKKNAHAK